MPAIGVGVKTRGRRYDSGQYTLAVANRTTALRKQQGEQGLDGEPGSHRSSPPRVMRPCSSPRSGRLLMSALPSK